MEAAAGLAITRGWDKLRMGMVAAAVGISRPTLYKHFGDKQSLAEAVVMREVTRFLAGVRAALAAHDDDPERAIAAAVGSALAEGERNPLLRMVLTPGPGGHTDLLRLITSEGNPVLRAIEGAVGDWAVQHFPDASAESLHLVVDALGRLALSYLVLPPEDPAEAAATAARMAHRYLTA